MVVAIRADLAQDLTKTCLPTNQATPEPTNKPANFSQEWYLSIQDTMMVQTGRLAMIGENMCIGFGGIPSGKSGG
ncbi:hypothetical protein MSG28_007732 [Choristoneura fumiferana]|uniref:Uncharacterized protein n=1 Tax=Choristoneura fumiferana TaxID=7141 RepID=A0ACC0JYL0_CHOFU|nr:hypothetical protein MSG28_007732 [Choristoneura fumiferana]